MSNLESFIKAQWPILVGFGTIVIAGGAAASIWSQKQSVHEQVARDTLYRAGVTLKQEETAAKDKKFAAASELQLGFAKTLSSLTELSKKYPKTRAAFEAELKVGDLYSKYALYEAAIPFYQSAVKAAPRSMDRALALVSVGFAYENTLKKKEALEAYDQALSLGEAALQGELLLAVARTKKNLGDAPGAKSTYEKIVKLLPNTEYAKTAELLSHP